MRKIALTAVSLFLVVFVGDSFSQSFVEGRVWGIWEREHSPYILLDDIHIPPDSTLRIMPGVEIIAAGHFAIYVDSAASLKALGTETDSIIFTASYTSLGHLGIRFMKSAPGCSLAYWRIEYGRANLTTYLDLSSKGGAIFCYFADPFITNCNLTNNSAMDGGGIYCYFSNPVILKNEITNNETYDGGGIFIFWSNPVVKDNIIANNRASYNGGGIYCNSSSPVIENNRIIGNAPFYNGGGIFCANSSPTIKNNIIKGNSSCLGAGIFLTQNSNTTIANNLIYGNVSYCRGSGITCERSNPIVINNTICDNSAEIVGGGICFSGRSKPVLVNNILYNNRASSGNEIYLSYSESEGIASQCSLFVAYCAVDPTECGADNNAGIILWRNGNINMPPMFADSLYHLSPASPCIDAGVDSFFIPETEQTISAPETDLEQNPRPLGSAVDIGAFEFAPTFIQNAKQEVEPQTRLYAYPNPFNSSLKITLTIPETEQEPVAVYIFNLKGEKVFELSSSSGEWQPENNPGSGVYLVQAKIGNKRFVTKVVYAK